MRAVCCIYHKPWAYGESSSEEDSSDDEGSGADDDGRARAANAPRRRRHRHHLNDYGEGETCPADGMPAVAHLEDAPGPNAYERASGKGKAT